MADHEALFLEIAAESIREALLIWGKGFTDCSTVTADSAMVVAHAVDLSVKSLARCAGEAPPRRHGHALGSVLHRLPLDPATRTRFAWVVNHAATFRAGVGYVDTRAYEIHTKHTNPAFWHQFAADGEALTRYAQAVVAHVRDGVAPPEGWVVSVASPDADQ